MKRFRTTLEAEIDVCFENPESAKKCYIDSDWCDTFWDLDSLEELAECISESFHNSDTSYDSKIGKRVKFLEGFGTFVSTGYDEYVLYASNDGGGNIVVEYRMELIPTDTHCLNEE